MPPCCRGSRFRFYPVRPLSSGIARLENVLAQHSRGNCGGGSQYGFEGLVAKNPASFYAPGKRSDSWKKMRVNKGQEFVVGGYTIGGRGFDALIFGYYDETGLRFAAKTQNGFTPSSRAALLQKMTPLVTTECPFVGLPEKRAGRWGQGITAEKMKDCVWLRPLLVAQFAFVEWTPDAHLRHASFIGLREDKDARSIIREP